MKIFISYRWVDSDAIAGRIRDRLGGRYGDDAVFQDINSIPFGKDIRQRIQEALAQSDVLIAIIGPQWLGADERGHARIHDETDAVRIEVETALQKSIPVIPLLIGTAKMPNAAQLPGSLKKLAFINAAPIDTGRDFHQHMERLFGVLDGTLKDTGGLPSAEATKSSQENVAFPGRALALSNIPMRLPTHFMGREDTLAAIEAAFKRDRHTTAVVALHGLRGVGKTTVAAAYAQQHHVNYRVTWWVRAQTESGMRADLVALGVRLGCIGADDKEEPALAAVMERLRQEGEGVLLVFDNVPDAETLKAYLPRGGQSDVLVTSNTHAWRALASPVEIRVWPISVGANYLVARTGRPEERDDAESLSEALGGLPLAHEQAAAYCERLEKTLADYLKRFLAAPTRLLSDARDAPSEYHDRLTVAKAFALAIEEVKHLHPAAEPLIIHTALLAPEPIPLFLFAEGRHKLGEPFAAALDDDGLDEAVSALRAFALVNRETVVDERDYAIRTDTIHLHRLVRQVAADRCTGDARNPVRRALLEALAEVYPQDIFDNLKAWPRARRLDGIASALVGDDAALFSESAAPAGRLLYGLAEYRYRALGTYAQAGLLYERALAIRQAAFGPEHPDTATSLEGLALLRQAQGDLGQAQPLFERALSIREKILGPRHSSTAQTLNNLALLLHDQRDFDTARPLLERALSIYEETLGPNHASTAGTLNNLALLLQAQGNLTEAQQLFERALAITEHVLGPEHPSMAASLNNLALVLKTQGELAAARRLYERALVIDENVLGPEHPDTAADLLNLGALLNEQGDLDGAQQVIERASLINTKVLGPDHVQTARSLNSLARLHRDGGRDEEARPLFERALAIREAALGVDHPETATTLNDLAALLHDKGELSVARPLYERALLIREKTDGPDHPETAAALNNLAALVQEQGDLAAAQPLFRRALDITEKTLGAAHPNTNRLRRNLAQLLVASDCPAEAVALSQVALAAHESALGPDHPWTHDSANTSAQALDLLGRSDDATKLRKQYAVADIG
jgi:tetratricopeptide (TPR) repeat protein